ncbi:hypothetical protein [Blastococcus sp. SYSU DS1024]
MTLSELVEVQAVITETKAEVLAELRRDLGLSPPEASPIERRP